jgi:8-oxo-dGTP pyrophosphatase MutT (NUDIX family)
MKVTDEKGNSIEVPDGIWEETVKAYAVKKSWPQDGPYFYIDDMGIVNDDNWADCDYEKQMLAYGNVYRTREEAEKVVAKRKAEAAIRRYIEENGLELQTGRGNAVYLISRTDVGKFRVSHFGDRYGQVFHFTSRADTEQVIDNCREHLEVLFDA